MWRDYSDFNDNESLYRQIPMKHELWAVAEDKEGRKLPQDEQKIMSCNFYDSFCSFHFFVAFLYVTMGKIRILCRWDSF